MFSHFYHGLIRRYVIAFGSLFNDITLARTDSSGVEIQRLKVPISYSAKEAFLVRLTQDPNLTKQIGIVLPRIGFEITGITYDAARALNRLNRRFGPVVGDSGAGQMQYVERPWNIGWSLHVYSRTTEDGLQILEQILPYWTPDFTVTVNTIPVMGVKLDVPIVLNSVNQHDVYEGNMETRRALIWTLQFTMKAAMYGPVKQKRLITDVTVDTYTVPSNGSMEPPDHLQNEDGSRFELEDSSGFLLTEDDPGDIGQADVVSRVRVRPDPNDAQPGDAFGFDVTVEHFD